MEVTFTWTAEVTYALSLDDRDQSALAKELGMRRPALQKLIRDDELLSEHGDAVHEWVKRQRGVESQGECDNDDLEIEFQDWD